MISIVITTYGNHEWVEMAEQRAHPSAIIQNAYEVILHHEPNLTIGPARNNAIARASGDYVCCLDADDELAPGYIATMQDAIDNHPTPDKALFYPAVAYVFKGRERPPLMRPVADLRVDNFLVIGTVVSRDLLLSVGGFNDEPHGFEDWTAWAKCWRAGASVEQVPDAVYRAYVNPRSAHRQGWRNRAWQVENHLRVQAELFPEGV